MFRISVDPSQDFAVVVEELLGKIGCKDAGEVLLSEQPTSGGASRTAQSLIGQRVDQLGLKNGDMLFVTVNSSEGSNPATTTTTLNNTSNNQPIVGGTVSGSISIKGTIPSLNTTTTSRKPVQQLPVDTLLDGKDGRIKRSRSYMCRHGDKGMCEYCLPLPPWDKGYREEHGFKHKSFHAHVAELNEQKNNKHNATSYMAPLEEPDYVTTIDPRTGVRTGPTVVTLQQQQFRMVDHVELADSQIMNQFIDVWRQTGVQRFGYMYGRYEEYPEVPLGVKAVVEAIYEPPQAGEVDGLTLLEWTNEKAVDQVAEALGLMRVGIIFTDLTDLGMKNGTVLCKRHKDTYFLSCLEIMMAGRNQLSHKNATVHSASGEYLSKFVTCVISGGIHGEIEPRSYQVSVAGEALVRADIITGTTQPSILHINDSAPGRIVPDVFYSKINEYGLEVKTNAKPSFPVEFLLVSLLDSFPKEPKPQFNLNFTIENRDFMGELQELKAAYRFLNSDVVGDGSQLVDFHFLVYLLTKLDILGDSEAQLLLTFARDRQYEDYLRLVESPGWMTLVTILEQST